MQAFSFYCPTRILFGRGTEQQVGEQVRSFGGTKVLIVYGGQSARRSGLLERVEESLTGSGLSFVTLGGVQPNPRLSLVREGIRLAGESGADFILGVGGGSVIDTAKAVAHGAANPELDIWDDIWMKKVPLTKTLPVGAVLTISAAGSELSDSAVLTDEEHHLKRGLGTDLQRPKFAIMNPELTFTLPRYQVACGAVDILMHTLERYFTPVDGNALTDELAEGIMRTVVRFAPAAVADAHDYDAMSELMWAGALSHNGLTELGRGKDFSGHQLGHELSARFDVAHGASLSVMWPCWARYCVDTDPARFARFGEKVWGLAPTDDPREDALRAIGMTEFFFRSLDMPTCFTELGIGVQSEAVLEDLATRCTFFGTRSIGRFRTLGHDDILSIYRMANR
ncbi:MAG: iron-containing alcohol dehydrogenase [Oscillospiraceae bacterium]|nr:iron-containing alcohol dehydrogenase [Oscillospiraceae bacterium]